MHFLCVLNVFDIKKVVCVSQFVREAGVTSGDIKLSHAACISDLMRYKKNKYPKKAPFLSWCHGASTVLSFLASVPFQGKMTRTRPK